MHLFANHVGWLRWVGSALDTPYFTQIDPSTGSRPIHVAHYGR